MTITKYDARPHMTLMTSKKIDIRPRKLYLEFALMNLDSDEASQDSQDNHTAVLHKKMLQIIWAEGFALGSIF